MDEGEPSQLYKTLLLEQEYKPSQAVEVLIAYYQMSEEEAWLVSKQYHATRAINGYNEKQLINSH
jgi:ATP-dependent Clp protease adapter protein ClpS